MPFCGTCGIDFQSGATCSCENNVVHNHVLAYCQTFLNNEDVNSVAKAVEIYFSEMDLINARRILRNKFFTQLASLEISKVETRRSSAQRTCSAMNAQDITDAVYKLTKDNEDIQFVTYELRKLPILQPHSVLERSIAERVLFLEKKLMQMEESNEAVVKEHDTRINRAERELQRINDNKRQQDRPRDTLLGGDFPSLPTRSTDSLYASACKNSIPDNMDNSKQYGQSEADDGAQADTNRNDDNGWQVQRNSRKRTVANSNPQQTKKKFRIQGTATGTGMKGGPGPNRDLWVCNVDKDISDEDMKTFVEQGGSQKSGKVNVRLWEPRYQPHWDNKRFRLTIPLCDYERVFNAEFWPEQVWIKKYWVDLKKEREKQAAGDKDAMGNPKT